MEYKVLCLVAVALILGFNSSAQGQAVLTEAQCTVAKGSRFNCGPAGVTPAECYNKGCCYDSSIPDAIWCFYPRPDEECLW
ncbi:putative gastrointestinal growth factor xP1 [Ambystoma mexicanum]|uniref:putative gastrointestinal growth factor xP1 n=1 Tax=Ambystoma mexicanum TaxID=8296 RepID=UPI0037E849DE